MKLQDRLEKKLTRAEEAEKRTEAFKTLNSVLVKANSEFMAKLRSMLTEKMVQHSQLQEALEKGNGTEEQNAEYLYLGGYVQCLKDILGIKPKEM
jgi:hypothetical protein